MAEAMGLGTDDYLRLVQRVFKPGKTVSLQYLEDDRSIFAVLRRYYPNISKDVTEKGPSREDLVTLYRLAGTSPRGECLFWDRLFADYRALDAGPEESLRMVLHNVRQHKKNGDGLKTEFVGRLQPIPELEKLDLNDFTRVITPYFKANIKAFISLPAFSYAHKPEQVDGYARRLAQDMYMAGKAFGVPMSLMISISHQESYFANVLGDNSLSASPFQIYQPTKPYIIKGMAQQGIEVPRVPERLEDNITLATYMAAFYLSDLIRKNTGSWGEKKHPICDLDRVALSYNGGEAYPEAVYKKKMRLMGYLDRVRQVAVTKQQKPRS